MGKILLKEKKSEFYIWQEFHQGENNNTKKSQIIVLIVDVFSIICRPPSHNSIHKYWKKMQNKAAHREFLALALVHVKCLLSSNPCWS